jgi:hypothetical protein
MRWIGAFVVFAMTGAACAGRDAPAIEPAPSAAMWCPRDPATAGSSIDARVLLGMDEADAVREAAKYGCSVAVIERDGESFDVPANSHPTRLNVVVDSRVIVGLRGVE